MTTAATPNPALQRTVPGGGGYPATYACFRSSYRSKDFASACHSLGLSHLFTKPYRPQTNGKAERFIQTLTREWPMPVRTTS